jgi:hypothetical protein
MAEWALGFNQILRPNLKEMDTNARIGFRLFLNEPSDDDLNFHDSLCASPRVQLLIGYVIAVSFAINKSAPEMTPEGGLGRL